MTSSQRKLGIIICSFINLALIPVRLTQGQGEDMFNLIGSQIGIWVMCFSSWALTCRIERQRSLPSWQRIALAMLSCSALSIAFYYAYNPYFEDYPMQPIFGLDRWVGLLRLSLRGALLGSIIVPMIFYIENVKLVQSERLMAETKRAEDLKEHNRVLEQTVRERTMALEDSVNSLEVARQQLKHQLDIQVRMVASISHDVSGPFRFIIQMTKMVRESVAKGQTNLLPTYLDELDRSLTDMHGFLQKMLEFAKTQLRTSALTIEPVQLNALIREKLDFFEAINRDQKNQLVMDVDPLIRIRTNYGLFSIVIHNLVDNASKYTIGGRIRIYTVGNDSEVRLVFRNDSQEMPQRITEWFNNNGEPSNGSGPGEGIGLILIKEISEMLAIPATMHVGADYADVTLSFDLSIVDQSEGVVAVLEATE